MTDPQTASSASPQDSPSSLRAKALLTLKKKPRTLTTTTISPPRQPLAAKPNRPDAIVAPAVQLDYGQDDALVAGAPATFTHPRAPLPIPPHLSRTPSGGDDGQNREEGEISESERNDPTPTPPPSRTAPSYRVASMDTDEAGPSATPSDAASTPRETSNVITSPSPPFLSATSRPSPVSPFTGSPPLSTPITDATVTSSSPTDPRGVRPGLSITDAEYNMCKDIVLDLLGWGVPSEYLVSCGLSREIVFYVFTELQLRLPTNLDTTGLTPYIPPAQEASGSSDDTLVDRPSDVLTAPSSATWSNPQSALSPQLDARRPSLSHPLPPKPPPSTLAPTRKTSMSSQGPTIAALAQQTIPGLSALAPAFVPTGPSTPGPDPNADLHDMEARRRQELLARKAAIESRKSRVPARSAPSAQPRDSPPSEDVDMAAPEAETPAPGVVAPKVVDDFLNSLGSALADTPKIDSKGKGKAIVEPDRQAESPEPMNVDDANPGSDDSIASTASAQTVQTRQVPKSPSSTTSAASRPISVSASSFTSDSGQTSRDSADVSSGLRGRTLSVDSVYGSSTTNSAAYVRRGPKRPVAADFVDFVDMDAPISSLTYDGIDDYNIGKGTGTVVMTQRAHTGAPPHKLRKAGSFASVSLMRRCVIEWSDEEGDDGEEDEWARARGKDAAHARARSSAQHKNSRAGVFTPSPRLTLTTAAGVHASGPATPTSVATNGAGARTGTMSPAALAEKEREIIRMREMIAQRELGRLRKQASMSESRPVSTPATPEIPAAILKGLRGGSSAPDSVKTEDVQMTSAESERDDTGASSASSSRPQTANASDVDDEAAIAEDLVLDDSPTVSETHAAYVAVGPGTPPPDTAIDGSFDRLQHATTGERVLTAEAREELVDGDSHQEQDDGLIDDPDQYILTSGHTEFAPQHEDQTLQQHEAHTTFTQYYPLLARYPLLHSLPVWSQGQHSSGSMLQVPSDPSQRLSTPPATILVDGRVFTAPDVRPLKLATTNKALDASKRICQYEVPGGGECRDAGCEDLHLGRLAQVEPSDEDTAGYVQRALPPATRASVADVKQTLVQVRQRHGGRPDLQHLVNEVCAALLQQR